MKSIRNPGNFENIGTATLICELDTHRDGIHVALLAVGSPDNVSAVWNRGTGRLVWQPAQTQAIVWSRDGTKIILLRESRSDRLLQQDPEPITGSGDLLEYRSWPSNVLESSCRIEHDGSWTNGMVLSPDGTLLIIVSKEQHVAGIEFVAISDTEMVHLTDRSFRVEPNGVDIPTFSPDGRFLVTLCGDLWWTDDPAADYETPSLGGTFDIGSIRVDDLIANDYWTTLLHAELPDGWLAPEEEQENGTLIALPIANAVFCSEREFTIDTITGHQRRFRIGDEGAFELLHQEQPDPTTLSS